MIRSCFIFTFQPYSSKRSKENLCVKLTIFNCFWF